MVQISGGKRNYFRSCAYLFADCAPVRPNYRKRVLSLADSFLSLAGNSEFKAPKNTVLDHHMEHFGFGELR
jgi:hypothetical protein